MNKFLISDLDGTFLNIDGSVPENSNEFIDFFHSNGFFVVFATARPHGNLKADILKNSKPDWIICNDGAIVIDNTNKKGVIILENNLSESSLNKFITFFTQHNLYPIFFLNSFCNFAVYIHESFDDLLVEHIHKSDQTRKIYRYKDRNKFINCANARAITLYGDIGKDTFEYISSNLDDDTRATYYKETRFDGKFWLDIISKLSNKAIAAKTIMDKFNISGIDVALGNGLNDIEMIKIARISYCPKSAHATIKQLSSHASGTLEGKDFLSFIMKHWSSYYA